MKKKEQVLQDNPRFVNHPFEFGLDGPDYTYFNKQVEAVKSLMNISTDVLYIKDMYKDYYTYIGGDSFYITGYTNKEMAVAGQEVFRMLIDYEDAMFLLGYEKLHYDFIQNTAPARRKHVVLFEVLHFKHKNGSKFPVTMQVAPFLFDPKNNPWALVGRVSLTPKSQERIAYIEMKDTGERYVYSPQKKAFVFEEAPKLTKTEQKVMILSARGFTEKESADEMAVSTNTVKKHKSNILSKLKVDNMSEAFIVAINQSQI
jgi:DNA-binding CsgD family transcriptional regulator